MMKSIAFAAALAIIPASAYAQSYGPIIRDPAGGSMRDPALAGYGWYGGAYGTYGTYGAINESPRVRVYVMEQPAPAYRYGQPVVAGPVLPRGNVGYREVPIDYGYRDTAVNDDIVVIIQPRSRRVVRTID
ncbi:MAG TPA: DUF1236 domain-containing protein [Bosea sp. (in: a-proteobacteria)]|jgi:hypothetical protein|uniref:DUF1236 domain-containing protein n=1 Tax=Bosea sp. (in: a-proteobacteria) TaxID=1871050 RepID=UPI002E0DD4E0|nr:DUF1236 domain-containing protein [Bosea sp. (in: a-proteobacteria)]